MDGCVEEIEHKITELESGQNCPCCNQGKLYKESSRQQSFEVIVGSPFLKQEKHHREVLRCNLCKEEYKAKLPKGIDCKKSYTPSAVAAVANHRYIMGLPHYRIARSNSPLKATLNESTMFNMSEELADNLLPIFEHLKRRASNSDVVHIDDTRMKILEHQRKGSRKRSATRTSAFLGALENNEKNHICLFQTGEQLAGEFFSEIIEKRSKPSPVVLVSDALNDNNPNPRLAGKFIQSGCLAHARRKFYQIHQFYPELIQSILDEFSKIYRVEKLCYKNGYDPFSRRMAHKKHSTLPLTKLWVECYHSLKERKFEPNDGAIGSAMRYFLRNFSKLTKFLSLDNCPLDNNAGERILKRVILHRKNSLFYKTQIGAEVGDVIMSVGLTASLAGVDPQIYFEDALLNFKKDEANLDDWLPWNWLKRKQEEKLSKAA